MDQLIENLPPIKGKKTSSDLGLPKFRDSEAFSFDVRDMKDFQIDANGHLIVADGFRQPSGFYRQAHNSGQNVLKAQGSFNSHNNSLGDVNR